MKMHYPLLRSVEHPHDSEAIWSSPPAVDARTSARSTALIAAYPDVPVASNTNRCGLAFVAMGVLYLATQPDFRNFFGRPRPVEGARIRFAPDLMFEARERLMGRPVVRTLDGDEGLVVHEDATVVLAWPTRLWRVDHMEAPIRRFASNRWVSCQALTVIDEAPSWLVFGERGDRVAAVLAQAASMTDPQARALVSIAPADSHDVFAEWTRQPETQSALTSIGSALLHLARAVDDSAHVISSSLFIYDDVDEVDVLGDPDWIRAQSLALATAAFVGLSDTGSANPKWMSEHAEYWASVMGPNP